MNPPAAGNESGVPGDGAAGAPSRLNVDELIDALGSVGEGVLVRNSDGTILWANERAAFSLGFETVDELKATNSSAIAGRYEIFDLQGNPMPADLLPNRMAALGEEPPSAVLRYSRDSDPGIELWSEVRSRPIKEPDGSVRCVVTFFRDVTETQDNLIALRESRARLSLLSRVGPSLLAASLSVSQALSRVAEIMVPEIADYCSIQEIKNDGSVERTVVRQADPSKGDLVKRLLEYDEGESEGVRAVARTGEPALVSEITREQLAKGAIDDEHLAMITELNPLSGMVVPIPARGRVVAVLMLVTAESGRRLGQDDLAFVLDIARRAGLAIDNGHLFEQQSRTARILQESLLPPELPVIPGIDLAARYLPASGEIGGDFYDAFSVGTGRWLVTLGDVCGKGPEAARFTSMVRYTLRAAATPDRTPSEILYKVNSAMLRQTSEFQFCTLVCAIIEISEGPPCLTLSLAGHPQPLIARPGGKVAPLGGPGTLLGGFEDPVFYDETTQLKPGEVVMFFTDGALDRDDSGTQGIQDHLSLLAAGDQEWSAAELARSVEELVVSRRPMHWADDLAILVLKVPK